MRVISAAGSAPEGIRLTLALFALSTLLAVGMFRGTADLNLPAPVTPAIALASEPPVTPPGRVLLIVIDGLRADVAARLPGLQALAAKGARAQLWADGPTFSTAQYVALLTGAPPRDSGVRTNATIRAAGLDDVAARVVASGRKTLALSDEVDWWNRLFPDSFPPAKVVERAHLVDEARRLFPGTAFALIHLVQVDHAGHEEGASSALYRDAAAEADATAAELVRAWDGAVVVVADHGHRERGGHGGDELDVSESFLIAAGPGVRVGARLENARSIDVAATLAALLGTSAPAQGQGRTLTRLLTFEPGGLEKADAARAQRVEEATRIGRASLERTALVQLCIRAATVLALLAGSLVWLRRPAALGTGLTALLISVAAFRVLYGPVSFSAARGSGWWVAGALAISFVTAIAALRWRVLDVRDLAALVLGASPLALAAFVSEGMLLPRLNCEPGWLAAGPIYAYTTLAPAALVAAVVALQRTGSKAKA